jgi:adenylate cyclase
MSDLTFKVTVQKPNEANPLFERELSGTVEFGRQDPGLKEPPPFCLHSKGDLQRVIIAPIVDNSIPRHWFKVEMTGPKLCKLTNISPRSPVRIDDREFLEGGMSRALDLPIKILFGANELHIDTPGNGDDDLFGLPDRTIAPSPSGRSLLPRKVSFSDSTQNPEKMIQWLQAMLGLLQSAASTTDFFRIAAKSLVSLMGMDSGRVLLFDNGKWTEQAAEGGSDEWRPSQKLLNRVLQEKRTYRHAPGSAGSGMQSVSGSMAGITIAIVSPILNPQEEVIGVLYGERRTTPAQIATPFDAKLVEVLAWGVATGLARIEQEAKAVQTRTRMEQFFTPQIARHLEENSELLVGRTCEISVLFADIRKFSTISHNLGPARTMNLINAVLHSLCECVLAEDGVLVDFGGDDLMAMWGAPVEQADHADRACRAALAMLQTLPKLNDVWQKEIAGPIEIGVGVNSGPAQVGNVGSSQKFKYGPLGSVVNLASRVQGLTKYFQTSPLITQQTRSFLKAPLPVRRLAQVRVVNIPEPVVLYEVPASESEGWLFLKKQYEDALDAFEKQNFAGAMGLIGGLLIHPLYNHDGPSLVLMQRAAKHLIEKPVEFSPVLEMFSK